MDEVLVRIACSPYHFSKNGNLKKSVFRSPPRKDEVSVIRHRYVVADCCKMKGQLLSDPPAVSGNGQRKLYRGLAVLTAQHVRDAGSSVLDSRHVYPGHADLVHGIVAPPANEPLDAALALQLDGILDGLLSRTIYYRDSDSEGDHWIDGELKPKA